MSFPSSFVRPAWKSLSRHLLFCGAALVFPILWVKNILLFNRPQLWNDAFGQLWGAEQLIVEKTFPLAGNAAFWPLRLGPLAYLLTALPQFVKPGVLSSYVLIWSLYLLSVPLFYVAVWRFLGHRAAAFAAAFWFAITPNFKEPLLELTQNDSFLPVFLAFYSLLLLRRPQKAALLPLYAVIGLAMQLHLTAVCLIPSTLIFLWQDRRTLAAQLPWHALGLLVVVFLHVTVMMDASALNPRALAGASQSVVENLRRFNWPLFSLSLRSAAWICLPAIVATPTLFVAYATMNAAMKKLLPKLALILGAQILAAAFFAALKSAGTEVPQCYFAVDTPFLGLLLAAAIAEAARLWRGRPKPAARNWLAPLFPAAAVALVFATLAARNGEARYRLDDADMLISNHVANAAAMDRWLRENRLPGVAQIVGYWFLEDRHDEIYAIWPANCDGSVYRTFSVYKTLFCLQHPRECPATGGETVFQLTFEFCDDAQQAAFVGAPDRVLANPEQCTGPVPIAGRLISYFCRGPRDPTRPAARVTKTHPRFRLGVELPCATPRGDAK